MKKAVSAIFLVLFLFHFITAQEKPLTQPEYVKMLYGLQKNPGGKEDIIAALRSRGIDFDVTDGMRSLTKSKGANDEELKRALEEAGRRRQNPASAKLPPPKEAADILEKARKNTLDAAKDMPDFVVKQLIARSAAYAGTGNWKQRDNLIIAVSYSEKEGEQYRILAIDGVRVNAERGSNYGGLDGATTNGEFVKDLETVFKPETKTEFVPIETDVIRGRAAFVYEYEIKLGMDKNMGLGYGKNATQTTNTGQTGKVWIDRETFRVLRLEYNSTDIPKDFPIRAFRSSTDFDWIAIAEEKYLLPILSDVQFTILSGPTLYTDRNLIRFKNYQKFGTDITILDDDDKPVKDEEKPKP
jgi:hypothetical protein